MSYSNILLQTEYPSNIMRNFALDQVFTEYVFLNDIDFMPDFNLYQSAFNFILRTRPKRPNASEVIHFFAPSIPLRGPEVVLGSWFFIILSL